MSKKKYAYGDNDEIYTYSEYYEKPEDGFNDAINELSLSEGDILSYGECVQYDYHISAYDLVDQLRDEAISECGDCADGFLSFTSKEKYKSLEDHINKSLKEWIKENNEEPSFYKVINSKEVIVTKELIGKL